MMSDLNKNDIYTVIIESCASGGEGVARIGGRAVFVRGALMGEKCEIRILKSSKTAVWAKIERILEPSPERTEPECPAFGLCGGCDFLHVSYSEELRMKKARVQEALKRLGGTDIEVSEIIGADEKSGYRNKVIYNVAEKDGRPVFGFYRQRSHDVIPGDSCLIQSRAAGNAAGAVIRWMEKNGVRAYDEATGNGDIRRIFCRRNREGQTQIAVVTAGRNVPRLSALVREIRESCPEAVSILQNINESRGNTVFAGEFVTLWGSDRLNDTLCGLKFSLSPRSFYQINRDQAEKLYRKALEYAGLSKTETALDLYCGTGTITLCLAREAGRVIGAEIVEDAVIDARKNAAENGIENVEFICADAKEAAAELLRRGLKPDLITLDPPRKGLDAQVIDAAVNMAPKRIVYVSCDPVTLARDIKIFSEKGYAPVKAAAVDMFPRCAHVESVVKLTQAGL